MVKYGWRLGSIPGCLEVITLDDTKYRLTWEDILQNNEFHLNMNSSIAYLNRGHPP